MALIRSAAASPVNVGRAALGLAGLSLVSLVAAMPLAIPTANKFGPDSSGGTVVAFAAAAVLFTVIVVGYVPAFHHRGRIVGRRVSLAAGGLFLGAFLASVGSAVAGGLGDPEGAASALSWTLWLSIMATGTYVLASLWVNRNDR